MCIRDRVGCVEGRTTGKGSRFELDVAFGDQVDAICERMGLIVRPLLNMCVFSPPLIIQRAQIDEMFDILDAALDELAR